MNNRKIGSNKIAKELNRLDYIGIYILADKKKKLCYVGKSSISIISRVRNHLEGSHRNIICEFANSKDTGLYVPKINFNNDFFNYEILDKSELDNNLLTLESIISNRMEQRGFKLLNDKRLLRLDKFKCECMVKKLDIESMIRLDINLFEGHVREYLQEHINIKKIEQEVIEKEKSKFKKQIDKLKNESDSLKQSNKYLTDKILELKGLSDKNIEEDKFYIPIDYIKDRKYRIKEYAYLLSISNNSYLYKQDIDLKCNTHELGISYNTVKRHINSLIDIGVISEDINIQQGIIYKFINETDSKKGVHIDNETLKVLIKLKDDKHIKLYCLLKYMCNNHEFTYFTNSFICNELGLSTTCNRNIDSITKMVRELEKNKLIETNKTNICIWDFENQCEKYVYRKGYRLTTNIKTFK